MIKSRIDIRTVPNPNTRVYELSIMISKSFYTPEFRRPFRQDKLTNHQKEVGETAIHLLKEIFALPGVEMVFVEQDGLTIVKAEASDWEDVEAGIIKTLEKTFREEAEEVVISRSPMFRLRSIDELFGPDFGNW